jgi:hypothetical protein
MKKRLDLNLGPEFGLDLVTGHCYTTISCRAEIAQSVEQGTENPRVRSSILRLGTSKIKDLRHIRCKSFFCSSPSWSHSGPTF